MIIYGRNAVHEALRAGRAGGSSACGRPSARRASPGCASSPTSRSSAPAEVESRCGSPDHQGICAEAGGYPYVGAAELLAAEDPFIVALDELQDPQNLGAICRSAECAGATGVIICERRAAAVTPAVAKASAGAVEHLRIARVRNLADFLADAKSRRLLDLRRRRRRARRATTSPTTAAASCSCWAARAAAFDRASRSPATGSCRSRSAAGCGR